MRYPAAAALFALTFAAAIAAQGAEPRNLVLNSGAESGKNDEPSIWFRASVPAEGLSMARDRREPHSGEASLFIGNTHDYGAEPVANNWGQSLQEVPTGRTLALSSAI